MRADQFWKNFKMGQEISVSGTFIYNGLRSFHEMRTLEYHDEIFSFLYDLSVGLERLLKVAVVLYEHDESVDQGQLEASLITHNHLELLRRVKQYTELTLTTPHNDFLSLLSRFYKSLRYDRFSISSIYDYKTEKKAICTFLNKYLDDCIDLDEDFFGVQNEDRYRKFIRKIVLKISTEIFEHISERARELNLYTYEQRHGSKAEAVFLGQVDLFDEDVLWKEILVYLMNTTDQSGYLDFIRNIEPLGFDPALIGEYIDCFQSNGSKGSVKDEIEELYGELEDKKLRLEMMKVIGAKNVYFDSDEEDEDEDEDF